MFGTLSGTRTRDFYPGTTNIPALFIWESHGSIVLPRGGRGEFYIPVIDLDVCVGRGIVLESHELEVQHRRQFGERHPFVGLLGWNKRPPGRRNQPSPKRWVRSVCARCVVGIWLIKGGTHNILGGSVPPGPENLHPISDHYIRLTTPYFRPDSYSISDGTSWRDPSPISEQKGKFYTLFKTRNARKWYPQGRHIPVWLIYGIHLEHLLCSAAALLWV